MEPDKPNITLLSILEEKIKHREELTAEEELLYLVRFEQMPIEKAKALVKEWYNPDK